MKNIELAADALFAGYDGKTIVSDVSITIPQNKISVILGANGCGKSTLLETFKARAGKHSLRWKKHFLHSIKADGTNAWTSSAVTSCPRRH